jgi:polyisoprenoid-binding protein YceI
MIATVKGRFGEVQGTVELDPLRIDAGHVDVSINAASIDTRSEQRDAHLRSPDFFDVEKYPTITYRSRRIEQLSGGQLLVVGDLTIRGITREVPLTVTPGGFARDPWGNERAAYVATTEISRGDFGLTWNAALETGGVLVGDEVKINLEVELVRQAAQAAA